MRMILRPTLLIIMAIMISPAAFAEGDPQLLGKFSDWTAYKVDEGGKPVCYMASEPTKSEGKYSKRGDIYVTITHRPSEKSTNVFSVMAGYRYKSGGAVNVKIDEKNYVLVPHEETAWTPSQDIDNEITSALRKGKSMSIEGTSARGTLTKDIYSLNGSGQAYEAISKACGI
ncbi:MAG: hypothetical protein GC136_01700 [Alphaproteobacteria bacterium]|nr:hypothetical protein [Alphaproteobacteria bacterium]